LSLARVPLFSLGMRPFFPLAAAYGALAVAAWVPWYLGWWSLPAALPPAAWHAHELLFGFMPAVLAGFLLTAVPNWTGRPAMTGWPLAGLVGLWGLGRLAVGSSEGLSPLVVAVATLVFPMALTAITAREVIAARNQRNLKVVACLLALVAAQALFHWEWAALRWSPHGEPLAIAALVMLILIVGGRIVPAFTTNWIRKSNPGPVPAPTGRLDRLGLVASAVALAGWVLVPTIPSGWILEGGVAALLAVAGLLTLLRQVRWVPHRTLSEPLVAVLHGAHALVGLGFLVAAIAVAWPLVGLDSAAIHVWTAGAIPLMSLAVMTRAARGHSGRALTAPPGTVAIYVGVAVAMLARVLAVLLPSLMLVLLPLAAVAWVAALLGFVALYAPMLARRPANT